MTSKLTRRTGDSGELEKFPDFPPRDDMQNSLHLDRAGHQAMLTRFLGGGDNLIVLSEIPVRHSPLRPERHRIPDLLIAFDVDFPLAAEQNGYSIRDQGKPPDFVLEVASLTTGARDYTDKREDYADFGIPEYWRFDASGGRYHGAPMGGDRLVEGAYQPIELTSMGPDHLHGHSDVLGLDMCWDHGQLRWWDPATERYLMTFDETADARAAAEARAAAAQARVQELEAELERRRQT